MAFPDSLQINQQLIRKFVQLLNQESRTSQSRIFPPTAWANLSGLFNKLESLGDEEYEAIGDTIFDWLDEHQYESIKQALQTFKNDSLDDEDPDADPLSQQPTGNHTLRSAIQEAQNRKNLPTPPSDQDSNSSAS